METIQNAQPHIKRNLSSRLSRVCSYAYDLGHNLARFSNGYHEGTNGIVTTMTAIPGKTIVNVLIQPISTMKMTSEFWRGHYLTLITTGYLKSQHRAKRRNRSESFRQATIETRTIEIELPKPRGKEMHEQQYGDGTPQMAFGTGACTKRVIGFGLKAMSAEAKLGEVHKDYKLKAAE